MSASDTIDSPDAGQRRILLIDGHAMAFRAFFALPADSFTDGRGQATNAVYGFARMIVNVVQSERPTHLVVAFDLPGGTFRDRIYDQYKGGRDATPEAFHGQIGLIQQVLDALGVTWMTLEDYEADDIIATLSVRSAAEGVPVSIVSSDRDAIQLVTEDVTLLQPVKGVTEMKRMTPAAVEEKYGIPPERYPDLAALVGEQADNLPGVPGVGAKTAAKWILAYGDLHGIIAHADEITGKAGQSLRDHIADVERNRLMNAAVTDLELPALDTAELGHGDREKVAAVFDELAFGDTIRRDLPAALFGGEDDGSAQAAAEQTAETLVLEDAASLGEFLAGEGPLALALTEDVRAGTLLALALPGARGTAALAELDSEASAVLAAALEDSGRELRAADVPSLRVELRAQGYTLGDGARDLSLEAFVLRPGARSYDPEALATELGGARFEPRPRKPADSSLRKETPEVRAGHVDLARARLAEAAAGLHAAAAEIDRRGAEEPWAPRIVEELERPLQRVLESLHDRGIALDREALAARKDELEGLVAQARREAGEIVGEEVNLSSPKQLQVVLFETLKLPTTRKIASGHSTDAESLTDLLESQDPDSAGHRFLSWLLRFREMSKLAGYLVGLDAAMDEQGRVHTTFQQTAAATGRLASTEPNLQNIPVRTAEGQRIRDVFVAGEGFETLLTADYSQIEMRIMAHLSEDAGLIDAFRSGEDLHNFVASRVFGVEPDAVDPAMRSKTKAVSYGLAYGLSAFGLSRQLRISRAEATALRDGYFERFGGVRDYLHQSVEAARASGYTETILGRRRYLPDLTSDNRQRRENAERVALNSPIQGSAADIIKLAMLTVESRMREADLASRMLLQVHDELVVEVAPGELEAVREIVVDGMDSAYELSVPLEVGVGVGRTWREAAH